MNEVEIFGVCWLFGYTLVKWLLKFYSYFQFSLFLLFYLLEFFVEFGRFSFDLLSVLLDHLDLFTGLKCGIFLHFSFLDKIGFNMQIFC